MVGRILAELMIEKYFSNFLTEIDGETLIELTWNIDDWNKQKQNYKAEMNSNETKNVSFPF